jgi:site-specific recombinase XerD
VEKRVIKRLKRTKSGQPRLYQLASGAHLISWRSGGKRFRKQFADGREAKEYFADMLARIPEEGAAGVRMNAEARAEWFAAKRILEPFRCSILDAVRFYAEAKSYDSGGVLWRHAVDSLLQSLKHGNRRERTLESVWQRLRTFERAEKPQTLRDFNQDACRSFLSRPGWSARTRVSLRSALSALGNHCVGNGWMERNPVALIAPSKIDACRPAILHPHQVNRLLCEATQIRNGSIVARLALLYLAGLRPTEIDSLTLADITKKGIRVGHGKLRGRRSVRFVPYLFGCGEWLHSFLRTASDLRPVNFRKLEVQACAMAGIVKHGQDVPRHTFISCALAVIHDENRVARISGNSPDVIFRNYYSMVPEATAKTLGTVDSLRAVTLI